MLFYTLSAVTNNSLVVFLYKFIINKHGCFMF